MRFSALAILVVGVLLTAMAAPAAAGIVGLGVGVYGGVNFPLEGGGDAGSVIGAKIRVLPPIPMVGVEAYYSRIGQEDADDVWGDGGVSIDFDGEGFDVFGADLLIGSVRGVAGFKWYGIAGVNFVEFSDGDSGSEFRMGGELGLGVELAPPVIGLSVEARATAMILGWGDTPDPKMSTVTVGLNYYF